MLFIIIQGSESEERYQGFYMRLGALHVRCAGFIVYQVPTALVGTGGLTTRMTRMTWGPGWRRGTVVSTECIVKDDGTNILLTTTDSLLGRTHARI